MKYKAHNIAQNKSHNIAQRNIKKEIFRRFRVDIELYQHGSEFTNAILYNDFYNSLRTRLHVQYVQN
jgi:hypothetical protein